MAAETSILKVIVPRNVFNKDLQDIKLVFIGDVSNRLKLLLRKLERHITLNNEERNEINDYIPYFNTKIGKLKSYQLKFVYTIIPNVTNITHLELFIIDILHKLDILENVTKIKNNRSQKHNLRTLSFIN